MFARTSGCGVHACGKKGADERQQAAGRRQLAGSRHLAAARRQKVDKARQKVEVELESKMQQGKGSRAAGSRTQAGIRQQAEAAGSRQKAEGRR